MYQDNLISVEVIIVIPKGDFLELGHYIIVIVPLLLVCMQFLIYHNLCLQNIKIIRLYFCYDHHHVTIDLLKI